MPSKINVIILELQQQINNLKKEISEIEIDNRTINKITKTEKPPKYGLNDLLKNKLPTLSGWNTNPTDTINITNNSMDFCNTGNKVTGGADEYAYMEWNLNGFHHVLLTGIGICAVLAGSGYLKAYYWNGTNWVYNGQVHGSSTLYAWTSKGIYCSKFRLAFSSSIATTLSPNIRECCLWEID